MASTVLSAPSGAFSVSDTAGVVSPVFDRHAVCRYSQHRTAPMASTVLSAPSGAFSVSDTATANYLSHNSQKAMKQVLANDGVYIASKILYYLPNFFSLFFVVI